MSAARTRRAAGVLLVAGLAAIALALRLVLVPRSGLWIDEAQLVWWARLPSVGQLLQFVWADDSHPPLYYLSSAPGA